jgi:hypothetical protein
MVRNQMYKPDHVAFEYHRKTFGDQRAVGYKDIIPTTADFMEDSTFRWPSGYILRLKPDGSWELLSAAFKKPTLTLAAGSAKIDKTQWHQLELRFHGEQIKAMLDGAAPATIEDATHAHGMFALGTEWDHIQFDNLHVTQ